MSFYKQAKTDKWCILSETRNQWVLKKNQRSPTNFSSNTNLLLILALCSLYDFMIEKKFLFLCNYPIIWSLKSQACIMKCISIKSQWSVFRPIDISFLLKPYTFKLLSLMYKIFLLLLILKKYLTDLSKINIYFVLKHTLKFSTNSPFSDLKISLENIIRTVYLIGFEYAIKRKHVGDR